MDNREVWSGLVSSLSGKKHDEQISAFRQTIEPLLQKENSGFQGYFSLSEEQRQDALDTLTSGGMYSCGGRGPQLECAMMAALLDIAVKGQCILVCFQKIDGTAISRMTACIRDSFGLETGYIGKFAGAQGASRYESATKSPLVIVDYYTLLPGMRVSPACFPEGLSVIFMEMDLCLYTHRLMFVDKMTPCAYGMVGYCQTHEVPVAENNPSVMDIVAELTRMKLDVSGTTSYIDKNVADELNIQLGHLLKQKVRANFNLNYSSFTYRTRIEMQAALLKEIQKAPGDVVAFFFSEATIAPLREELRRAGQESVILLDSDALASELSTGNGKHVAFMRFSATTQLEAKQERKPVDVFVVDLPVFDIFYDKVPASIERVCTFRKDMQLYFSQEDFLMQIYGETGGFEKFFALMDFTEKYDSLRQIRRVLARMILKKLQKMRRIVLNENMPIVVSNMARLGMMLVADRPAGHKTMKKTEGLCFCGSGKPFMECHGKRK